MNRLLLGCILLAVSWTASAADITLYKVELIVFENLDPSAPQAEDWPADPGTPSLNNAMELDTLPEAPPPAAEPAAEVDDTQSSSDVSPSGDDSVSGDTPPPATGEATAPDSAPAPEAGADVAPPPEAETPSWRWMAKSELSLDGDEQKLINSGRYRPLLHIGWIQPLDSSDQGTPVHIYDGLKPKEDIPAAALGEEQVIVDPLASPPGETPAPATPNPLDMPPPQAGNEVNPPPPEEMPQQEQPPHVLDGTFTLRQGRYLHVDVDLGYQLSYTPEATPPDDTAPDDAIAQPVTRYIRMTQSRRIRSDELNYLDHPLIGVLFVVSPLPIPSADSTEK